jgi:hypothetical protein
VEEPGEISTVCTCISITCTTSWLDWVHGDLWLCPEGLLRNSRGLLTTLENVDAKGIVGTLDPGDLPKQAVSMTVRLLVADADKRNWWIVWEDIESAKQQSGPLSHALHLRLKEGRKVTFRWLRQEISVSVLNAALREALGQRFVQG